MPLKFKIPTIIGISLGAIILLILYFSLGVERIISNYPLIISIIILLQVIGLLVFMWWGDKIVHNIEPEDNPNLLTLRMNQSLAYAIALFGFGLAFVIPGVIRFPSGFIDGLILEMGVFLIYMGEVMFTIEYLPRYTKLEVIYSIKKGESKKNGRQDKEQIKHKK